jgi:hypothetical protein
MRLLAFVVAAIAALPSLAQTVVLSPAAVPLSGEPGQGVTQVLTLRNDGDIELDFVMEARDVVVRAGKREFVDPATLPDSIAASAVFFPRSVHVLPRSSASVTVQMTLPRAMRHRAAVAVFRGVTPIPKGRTAARLSLGTLFTFQVSDRVSVAPTALEAKPPSPGSGAMLRTRLVNDGTEPLVAAGAAVILDASGRMMGKVAFRGTRLLPGEARELAAEYAGELPAGSYRVIATFDIGGHPLTQACALVVVVA